MMISTVVGQECGWLDIDIAGVLVRTYVHGGQSVDVNDVQCNNYI